jgi:hypothetical protein
VHAVKISYSATYGRIEDAFGTMPTILKKCIERAENGAGLINKHGSIKIEKGLFLYRKEYFSFRIIQLELPSNPQENSASSEKHLLVSVQNIFEGTFIRQLQVTECSVRSHI